MSVVAWDGRILAADKAASMNALMFESNKITRIKGGEVLAWVGYHQEGLMLVEWYMNGPTVDTWPRFERDDDGYTTLVVAISPGLCVWYERYPYPAKVESEFMAWGVGNEVAMGAMVAGKDAREAVEIANYHVAGCGFGVDSHDLGES